MSVRILALGRWICLEDFNVASNASDVAELLVLKSPLEARLGAPRHEATRSAPRRG